MQLIEKLFPNFLLIIVQSVCLLQSCCYRKNGSLGLILNEEGGLIKQDPYDETYDNKFIGEGKEENKSWLWPADQMLDKPLIYRLTILTIIFC